MSRTVAIVGCLDTKGVELAYFRDRIRARGLGTHLVDTGVLGEPLVPADTPRERTAEAAGSSLDALRDRGDRGVAMEAMCRGASEIVRVLYARGAIHGIAGAGGSANTTVATSAMRALPVGFPKLMVSTLASGDVSPYVDTKDVTLMYSVVDIAGLNRLSRRILANAAGAISGMVSDDAPVASHAQETIATTMFGVTTPCVMEATRLLEGAGYEVLVFHATGTGGRAMEGLMKDRFVQAALDLTTTEIADEIVGGVLSAGPDRLTVAGQLGLPQVVSIGAVDMVNFGPVDTVPERFRGRLLHRHNPTVTLMRTTPEENRQIGSTIARRLNRARGPVKVILPLRGVSSISRPGEPFHDEEADRCCREAIRETLRDEIEVRELDTDINDPAFARACTHTLTSLLG